ncbi:MAG: citrate lyase acyl carrier protein [Eubacteriales bacterium]|nr:citrate lyase acyl carrier protein [Eubacteriales bacterium]
MKINKVARAGTMESSDIFIMVQPGDNQGLDIRLSSVVIDQYGNHIRNVIMETLKSMNIEDIELTANDRGALDYTIRSRVETAVKRAL